MDVLAYATMTAKADPPDENTVTTTISFDRATYKRLRLMAVEQDTNVRDLIRRAVADFMKRRTPDGGA
jgi:predicted transcriptional regulator